MTTNFDLLIKRMLFNVEDLMYAPLSKNINTDYSTTKIHGTKSWTCPPPIPTTLLAFFRPTRLFSNFLKALAACCSRPTNFSMSSRQRSSSFCANKEHANALLLMWNKAVCESFIISNTTHRKQHPVTPNMTRPYLNAVDRFQPTPINGARFVKNHYNILAYYRQMSQPVY